MALITIYQYFLYFSANLVAFLATKHFWLPSGHLPRWNGSLVKAGARSVLFTSSVPQGSQFSNIDAVGDASFRRWEAPLSVQDLSQSWCSIKVVLTKRTWLHPWPHTSACPTKDRTSAPSLVIDTGKTNQSSLAGEGKHSIAKVFSNQNQRAPALEDTRGWFSSLMPFLQVEKQAQKGEVTSPRSAMEPKHSWS